MPYPNDTCQGDGYQPEPAHSSVSWVSKNDVSRISDEPTPIGSNARVWDPVGRGALKGPNSGTKPAYAPITPDIRIALTIMQLSALLYNLEHGIIPAALPQLRTFYRTSSFLEAFTQCISVSGTQLGVFLVTTLKVPLKKWGLILAIFGVSIGCLGTRFTRMDRQHLIAIPASLFLWRFVSGICSSYIINLTPRWINLKFPKSRQTVQARMHFFGICGTVLGYILCLLSNPLGPADNDDIGGAAAAGLPVTDPGEAFVKNIVNRADAQIEAARGFFHNSTKTVEDVCSTHGMLSWQCVASGFWKRISQLLTQPDDFRRAFLWSALFGSTLIVVSVLMLKDESLQAGSASTEALDRPHPKEIELSSAPLLETSSVEQPLLPTTTQFYPVHFSRHISNQHGSARNCLIGAPNDIQRFIDLLRCRPGHTSSTPQRSSFDDLAELLSIPEYVGIVAAVWVNTTTAQAINFWLFTVYTIGLGTTVMMATLGVALVFVFGTITGLWLSTLVQGYGSTGLQLVIEGVAVSKEQLLLMTILCGLASLSGCLLYLAEGYWGMTFALTLSVTFGAAVMPIAQVAVGQCVFEEGDGDASIVSVPTTTEGGTRSSGLQEMAYGFHQFAFQSSWFFGPLLPVILDGVMKVFGSTGADEPSESSSRQQRDMIGFKSVVLFPMIAFGFMAWAYLSRRNTLKTAFTPAQREGATNTQNQNL